MEAPSSFCPLLEALNFCEENSEGGLSFRNARAIGVSEALVGEEPVKVVAALGGHRDPGYWETSRMLLESALCLAQQVWGDMLPSPYDGCKFCQCPVSQTQCLQRPFAEAGLALHFCCACWKRVQVPEVT